MPNPEHLAKLKEGADAWHAWRQEHPDVRPDLRKADLRGVDFNKMDFSGTNLRGADLRRTDLNRADLRGANLTETELSGADLRGADLRGAKLIEAILIGAKLIGADLIGAKLSKANLSVANLSIADLSKASLLEADLTWANFSGANLWRADFTETTLAYTTIVNVELDSAIGLETVTHNGPSSIGIDTIYKSGGNIPDVFLRGAGIPDDMIAYIHSTAGTIQFHSTFITYSTKDQDFAERLHSDLQSKGVRVWFAPEDIKGGRKVHEQITEAIRLSDKLLLVLSPHSMESEWVRTEIYQARQDEINNNKRKLFPISLVPFEEIRQWSAFDADVGKDMAREVREYFIPDFSNWKHHDTYQHAFDRLLRDLQAED